MPVLNLNNFLVPRYFSNKTGDIFRMCVHVYACTRYVQSLYLSGTISDSSKKFNPYFVIHRLAFLIAYFPLVIGGKVHLVWNFFHICTGSYQLVGQENNEFCGFRAFERYSRSMRE